MGFKLVVIIRGHSSSSESSFTYDNLHLDEFQLQNYVLSDMEQILIRSGRSLQEFETMPYPNTLLLR